MHPLSPSAAFQYQVYSDTQGRTFILQEHYKCGALSVCGAGQGPKFYCHIQLNMCICHLPRHYHKDRTEHQ